MARVGARADADAREGSARDSIAVRREGAAQVALVGTPNAGKSSLLQALSSIRIKTGDYAFTTLRPVPALVENRDADDLEVGDARLIWGPSARFPGQRVVREQALRDGARSRC